MRIVQVTAPEKIFLQVGDTDKGVGFEELSREDVTWSKEPQFDTDIHYVRSDKANSLRDKMDRLLALLDTYDYVMATDSEDSSFRSVLEDLINNLDFTNADDFFEEQFCSFKELNKACDEHGVQRVKKKRAC